MTTIFKDLLYAHIYVYWAAVHKAIVAERDDILFPKKSTSHSPAFAHGSTPEF